MKTRSLLAALLFGGCSLFAQDSLRTNPILFGDLTLGYAKGTSGGLSAGLSMNYQTGNHLFTARYISGTKIDIGLAGLPFIVFPYIDSYSNAHEYAGLYGIRLMRPRASYSISAGISHNVLETGGKDASGVRTEQRSAYPGMPFEVNAKWFKPRKERFRVYGIFPVGKPTAFGGSFGFKLYGNISRHPYLALGINLGLGYYKKYTE